ncbi:MAG: lmo0937 family membrane protein [Deltaproteobacteria bacterium]|nr:lmo0937 family membrane protein [Deltaproteobacteria bacterium]
MAPLRIATVILAGLWAIGMATSVSGGFVHALAVIAVVFLLVDFVKNRRVCR